MPTWANGLGIPVTGLLIAERARRGGLANWIREGGAEKG
jgi:hypothetical protein